MKDKHEQLYIAVQDLLIGLDITPEELRFIATNNYQIEMDKTKITAKTAQKLIDADLIVKEINWRKPGKVLVSDRNNEVSEIDALSSEDVILSTFNRIKSGLPPGILWSYLREKHPDFLHEQIKKFRAENPCTTK